MEKKRGEEKIILYILSYYTTQRYLKIIGIKLDSFEKTPSTIET